MTQQFEQRLEVKRKIISLASRILSKPAFSRATNFIFQVALRSKGYDNFQSFKQSGEDWLIVSVSKQSRAIAVDVGANSGLYSETLIKAGFQRVFCFEPHPTHRTSLLRLVEISGGTLNFSEKAIGDVPGQASLMFNSEALSHASFVSEANQISYVDNRDSVEVEVTTLDLELRKLDLTEISILKIDTEGYELEVLKGARQIIQDQIPMAIQIEFNLHQLMRGHTMMELSSHVPGYELFQLLPYGNGLRRVKPDQADANLFYFSNFVFLRPDLSGLIAKSR